ncbi:MAG: hypothetical protein ACRBK7_04050 [Acidimicrobiales bacterium]
MCTPGAEVLTDRINDLHYSFEALIGAFDGDDDSWEASVTASRRAMLAFEAEVRGAVEEQRTVFGWSPRGRDVQTQDIDETPAASLPSV